RHPAWQRFAGGPDRPKSSASPRLPPRRNGHVIRSSRSSDGSSNRHLLTGQDLRDLQAANTRHAPERVLGASALAFHEIVWLSQAFATRRTRAEAAARRPPDRRNRSSRGYALLRPCFPIVVSRRPSRNNDLSHLPKHSNLPMGSNPN